MASATFSVCLMRGWAAVRPDVRRAVRRLLRCPANHVIGQQFFQQA